MDYKETDKIFGTFHGIVHSDVFGKYDDDGTKRIDDGMVVAFGKGDEQVKCPIFGDILPYKSVTVICTQEQLPGVLQHLMNAHGGPHADERELPDGRIAIRSDYQAW